MHRPFITFAACQLTQADSSIRKLHIFWKHACIFFIPMPFPSLTQLDLVQIAQDIGQIWRREDIFNRSVQQNAHRKTFTFYEGPPSASGPPGIHHVLSRTVKDIFCRYKTQTGFSVPRRAGWDAHGLPVELAVEKAIGVSKEDIGSKISVADYNAHCQQKVLEHKAAWDRLTEKMGYWIDTQDHYITSDPRYIESVWAVVKQLYDRDCLYKGYTIQPYSPAAGTGLSVHELNQPGCYKSVKDTAITVQFQLRDSSEEYLLAWTTTPWTLPANCALAVNASLRYVTVRTLHPYTREPIQVILCADALPRYFTGHPVDDFEAIDLDDVAPGSSCWQVLRDCPGSALVGRHYRQLLPYVQPQGKAFQIVAADFVAADSGTGIVHIAPSFGAEDMKVARREGLADMLVVDPHTGDRVPIVDKRGRFVATVSEFAGHYVKDDYAPASVRRSSGYRSVDVLMGIKLKKENKAFRIEKHTHSYPHCWRTDKPILYYPLEAWFVRTTAYRDRLVALNKKIRWIPSATGIGRFEHWLEHLVDWNLSRTRYWGTPLPIWRTRDGRYEKCIGSLQDLRAEVDRAVALKLMQQPLPASVNLHRPFVDELILASATGEPMYREQEVLDVWFDSGAMPYAQWHYPFSGIESFQKNFPADFIAEGVDQTRGWFFTLHVLAALLFDNVASRCVVAHGFVLDKQGNKMSKRLGNTMDPFHALDQYGPDALRWYMAGNNSLGENLRFDPEGPAEVARKFFVTLHNTYNFFALYANLDCYQPSAQQPSAAALCLTDRWILARLQELVARARQGYEAYEPAQAVRALQGFVVKDLSNWYVRRNRKRFWQSENTPDKQAAYDVLRHCLSVVARTMAPIAPFYADFLYRCLHAEDPAAVSVHLAAFPEADRRLLNEDLTRSMAHVQSAVSLAHALRKKRGMRVRQPLSVLIVQPAEPESLEALEPLVALIQAEVNVKEVRFQNDLYPAVHKVVRPRMDILGERYKSQSVALAKALSALNPKDLPDLDPQKEVQVKLSADLCVSVPAEAIEIHCQDVPQWVSARNAHVAVALCITVNADLQREGVARELVHSIQELRKQKGLQVQDKIVAVLSSAEVLVKEAVEIHGAYIAQEVQAQRLDWKASTAEGDEVKVGKYAARIAVLLARSDTL